MFVALPGAGGPPPKTLVKTECVTDQDPPPSVSISAALLLPGSKAERIVLVIRAWIGEVAWIALAAPKRAGPFA